MGATNTVSVSSSDLYNAAVRGDHTAALELHRRADSLPADTYAMTAIAACYEQGYGGLQEHSTYAKSYYMKAARAGDITGFYNYGRMAHYKKDYVIAAENYYFTLRDSKGESSAISEAALLGLTKLANAGHRSAAVYLGKCYWHGYGVDANKSTAFPYLLHAAKQNGCMGMVYTDEAYLRGEGTSVNIEKAKYWLMKAAKKKTTFEYGSPRAVKLLEEIFKDYPDDLALCNFLIKCYEKNYGRENPTRLLELHHARTDLAYQAMDRTPISKKMPNLIADFVNSNAYITQHHKALLEQEVSQIKANANLAPEAKKLHLKKLKGYIDCLTALLETSRHYVKAPSKELLDQLKADNTPVAKLIRRYLIRAAEINQFLERVQKVLRETNDRVSSRKKVFFIFKFVDGSSRGANDIKQILENTLLGYQSTLSAFFSIRKLVKQKLNDPSMFRDESVTKLYEKILDELDAIRFKPKINLQLVLTSTAKILAESQVQLQSMALVQRVDVHSVIEPIVIPNVNTSELLANRGCTVVSEILPPVNDMVRGDLINTEQQQLALKR